MRPDDESFTGLDTAQRGRTPRGGAIYHLRVRTASRSKGQSARAACAYIERSAEYSRAADASAELAYTESGHMPGWAEASAGGAAYWDAADLYERSNGRLYKSMDFALPLALDADQQRALAVGFAHSLTDAEQLPYTLALHAGKGENPHCHLMISERGNDALERSAEQWFKRYNAAEPEHGGARKSTALKPKEWLEETRAAWAAQSNEALREAGLEIQIDHRSLAAQGIARVPGIHLGPHVLEMEARGIQTERGQLALGISQRNEQIQELQAQLREQLREEGREYGRDRQSEASPRAVPLSPRQPASPEPQRAADRDRAATDRDRAAADRVAELTPPDDGLAGGDQRAPGGALPDGAAAGRGAGGQRGWAVETGAGHRVGLDEPGARAAPGLGGGAQQSLEPPAGARTGAGLGPEPGAVEGAGVGGVGERGRGADLPPGRSPAHGHHGVDESAGQSLGLSPAVGHGDEGRAEDNPEASRRQDGREVDAAALATAQAQLAAAEAAIERAAAQAAARFAEAERRIERAAEQQRQREKQREKQREQQREKARGEGAELER